MVGKGSLNHNSREFYASNVDPSRSHLNIEFCREDIRDVYHELFDEAQDRFNAKQTRNDRRIEDYYEKICSSKQEKAFHEIVLQIGNKDDTGIHTELAEGGRVRIERMLSMVKYGRIHPERLVTHHLTGLDKIEEALYLMKEKPADLIKVMVTI